LLTHEKLACHREAKFPLDWRDRRYWYCADHYDMIVACWKRRVVNDDPSNPRYDGTKELIAVNGL